MSWQWLVFCTFTLQLIFNMPKWIIPVAFFAILLIGWPCTTSQINRIRYNRVYITEKQPFYGSSYRNFIVFRQDSTTFHHCLGGPLRRSIRYCKKKTRPFEWPELGHFSFSGDSVFVVSQLDQPGGISHGINENGRVVSQWRNQDTRFWKGKIIKNSITFDVYSQKRDTTYSQTYHYRRF